jgi:hypothetical protein
LYNFRKRAGQAQPPGAACHGWDCTQDWVEGSIAGLYLMGAGHHLQWQEVPALRAALDGIVAGIAAAAQTNGFIMAFNESRLPVDEHPDYTLSWTTHGLLAADAAGSVDALPLLRGMLSLMNNHTSLSTFLPPDGGNAPYQTPVGAPPPGWCVRRAEGARRGRCARPSHTQGRAPVPRPVTLTPTATATATATPAPPPRRAGTA